MIKPPNPLFSLAKLTIPVLGVVGIGALAIRETSKILSGESEGVSSQIPKLAVYGGGLIILAILIALPSARLRIITMLMLLALATVLIYLKSLLPI